MNERTLYDYVLYYAYDTQSNELRLQVDYTGNFYCYETIKNTYISDREYQYRSPQIKRIYAVVCINIYDKTDIKRTPTNDCWDMISSGENLA